MNLIFCGIGDSETLARNKMNPYDLVSICLYCEKENRNRCWGKGDFHFWCWIKELFTKKYQKAQAERLADFQRSELETGVSNSKTGA